MWTTVQTSIHEDWMDREQNMLELIWQSKSTHQGRCLHNVLWWDKATIPRNGCIRSRTGSKVTTYQGQLELSLRWRVREYHPKTDWIHQQKHIKCGKKIWQFEEEVWGILHRQEKFHHYCFAREESNNNVSQWRIARLAQRLQYILLIIYQYRIRRLYKPGPHLFKADYLSRENHAKNKDEGILDMRFIIDAVSTTTVSSHACPFRKSKIVQCQVAEGIYHKWLAGKKKKNTQEIWHK